MAKWFIIVGASLFLMGIVLKFAPWLLNWFGRLPGDLRFESGSTKVFIPLTSMIILSIVLTILVNLFKR